MQPEIIEDIVACHRVRCDAMEQRKRLDLGLGSHLRIKLGWRRDLPEKERKRIAAEAQAIMRAEEPDNDFVLASRGARKPFAAIEAAMDKQLAKLARQLPVWEAFGKQVRGFGEISLAIIVAEAGDLSNYDSEAKLWKRMGLAAGQGRVPPNLSREQRKQAWIERGYSPRRRSRMWNVGDALIKGNRDGVYRRLYLERKAFEVARNPEMSLMQAHRRAQRYMEKRLLRDLWRAWRRTRCSVSERSNRPCPPPQIAAEHAGAGSI